MGGVFYLVGISLAAYAGFNHYQWYYIFISSLIMVFGYLIIRAPQIQGIVSRDGISSIPKLLLIQVVVLSIFTAPVYYLASIFA